MGLVNDLMPLDT
jgi:paired amphipathic helix protein Sin3a